MKEIPFFFLDRTRGTSKLSLRIGLEALLDRLVAAHRRRAGPPLNGCASLPRPDPERAGPAPPARRRRRGARRRDLAAHGGDGLRADTVWRSDFPGAPEHERCDGLEVLRLGRIRWYYPRAVATLRAETRRGRFDVVVEHLNKLPFFAPAYSAVPVLAVNHHLFGRSAFLQVAWPIATTVVDAGSA